MSGFQIWQSGMEFESILSNLCQEYPPIILHDLELTLQLMENFDKKSSCACATCSSLTTRGTWESLWTLSSSQLGHLCFGESDESPPVLNSPLMMLSNSPLLLFFWPLAAAQRTRCCERKTHWKLQPLSARARIRRLIVVVVAFLPLCQRLQD